jgi:hypothetical protein
MADEDILGIWDECERELQANHLMAEHHQLMFEQSIANVAALKMLNDSSIEDAVKNS